MMKKNYLAPAALVIDNRLENAILEGSAQGVPVGGDAETDGDGTFEDSKSLFNFDDSEDF